MKKRFCFIVALAIVMIIPSITMAARGRAKIPPNGTEVSVINKTASSATLQIICGEGVSVKHVEIYSHDGPVGSKSVDESGQITVNTNTTNGFNVVLTDGQTDNALLITPSMEKRPPPFIGKGIGIDTTNPLACFLYIE